MQHTTTRQNAHPLSISAASATDSIIAIRSCSSSRVSSTNFNRTLGSVVGCTDWAKTGPFKKLTHVCDISEKRSMSKI